MSRTNSGLLAISAALLLAGCNGSIRVRGAVYEIIGPTAAQEGRAWVDEPPPLNRPVRPVADARVTLFYGGDYAKHAIDESTISQVAARTDAKGRFEISAVCKPREFSAAIRVEKPGFQTITWIFPHSGGNPHSAVVFLVPKPSP